MNPSALEAARHRLRSCPTRLTTADGHTWLARDLTSLCSPDHSHLLTTQLSNGTGYVIDHAPDLHVAVVRAHVCVGSQDAATHPATLTHHRVTHVLDVTAVGVGHESPQYKCRHLPLLDVPESSLQTVLPRAVHFIESARHVNGVCLVHCNAGVSRAPSVVAAYLMYSEGLGADEALANVRNACERSQRQCRPNSGFLAQLRELGEQLEAATVNQPNTPINTD